MLRRFAKAALKGAVQGYVVSVTSTISIAILFVGTACLAMGALLAGFDKPPFAIVFIVLGVLFVLLGLFVSIWVDKWMQK